MDKHSSSNANVNFISDGLASYGDAIRGRLGERAWFAESFFNVPRGATIALLGHNASKTEIVIVIGPLFPIMLEKAYTNF